MNVVVLSPILSVKMPETGDKKNVVPIVSEPTKAAMNETRKNVKQKSELLTMTNVSQSRK